MPRENNSITVGMGFKCGDDAALLVTIMCPQSMGLRDAATPVDLLSSLPTVINVPINEFKRQRRRAFAEKVI